MAAMSTTVTDAIAKVTDLARPIVETGCGLIESLLGEPCRVAGQLLSDQVYAWQWKNRIRIAARAQQIIDESKVAPRLLPPGFLLPLIEAAGNAEDESLQEMWANLLANAAKDDECHQRMYIETLRSVSAHDAAEFSRLIEADSHVVDGKDWNSYHRLQALGLLEAAPAQYVLENLHVEDTWSDPSSVELRWTNEGELWISEYGRQFFQAVSRS